MILENEDQDLEIISKYFQNQVEEYEVYEATRFLCYHHRQKEILDLITEYYKLYTNKIDVLMNIEEDSILFDLTIELWDKFKQQLKCVKEVLKYLDIKNSLNSYITDILLKLIKPEAENRLQIVTLQEIKRFRQKVLMVNQQLELDEPPLQLFDLLVQLPNFNKFENQFFEQTQEYYKSFILDTNPTQQIQIALKIYSVEQKLTNYKQISKDFQNKLNELLKTLIYNQVNLTDLDYLYFDSEVMQYYVKFCSETNSLPRLLSGLRKYIYKEVITILQCQPNAAIEKLLNLEQNCFTLFSEIFHESANQSIITHAIEDAVNENYQKYSYLLAYMINPKEVNSIQKYSHLIKYLLDKESFQNYYVKFLIQRIMKEQNIQEIEGLEQLQHYCSTEWIQECSEFIKSSNDSFHISNQFIQKSKFKKTNIQFHFHLIPKSIWPYTIESIILPNPLNQYAEAFIKFQSDDQLYQKKKIIFQQKQSQLSLQVKIDNQFELIVPLGFGLELLNFNHNKLINNISNYKQYNGLIIKQDNQFKINYQFRSLNQQMIINEEVQIELEKNQQTISDYLYVVDAAIVKIIKQNKNVNFETLIQSALDLIKKEYPRFIDLCEFEIIGKQIQSLIEKEIIKEKYHYFELL